MKSQLPHLRVRTADGGLVARDGIVICFFLNHSHGEIAHEVWRSLQAYLLGTPPQSLNWYPDLEGDWQPLNEDAWTHLREQVLENRYPASCSIDLEETCADVGGYNFEYRGRWLDAPLFRDQNSTCAVAFTLPTEYLVEHGPSHVRALALDLSRELPFSFGYASFSLVAPRGQWFMNCREARELRDRYRGLDIYKQGETSAHIGTRARGAYWLTFLGQPLLGQLGGLESLRQRLSFTDVSVSPLPPLEDERVLITLGEWPEVIDTERDEHPSPQLLALGRLLEPFLHEERSNWFSFLGQDREEMHRWTRRFCP